LTANWKGIESGTGSSGKRRSEQSPRFDFASSEAKRGWRCGLRSCEG
jgi:hypothetical protein